MFIIICIPAMLIFLGLKPPSAPLKVTKCFVSVVSIYSKCSITVTITHTSGGFEQAPYVFMSCTDMNDTEISWVIIQLLSFGEW